MILSPKLAGSLPGHLQAIFPSQSLPSTSPDPNYQFLFFFFFFFFFLCFLWPHPQLMEVSRLGIKLEVQLPAYATATAMRDPSHVCDLHHSSPQCRIPDPLSEARDRTCVLMDTSRICFYGATTGTPQSLFL